MDTALSVRWIAISLVSTPVSRSANGSSSTAAYSMRTSAPSPRRSSRCGRRNAAGRYAHAVDTHDAPLDANFSGAGRILTDAEGHFRFTTVKPGAYPWQNHDNAWRPPHVHFSVFGRSFLTRLVTQMYFPGDPLLRYDPIFNAIPSERARQRLVASFDLGVTQVGWALGYRFDIVLRGRDATPLEGS